MTPSDIITGLAEKNRMLTQKNDEYLELNEKRAAAERAYSIALSREMLNLKVVGQSVTLIDKLSKGHPVVADLKYALDVSEGVCKACLNAIKALTIQIDSYRSLLTWMREELHRA